MGSRVKSEYIADFCKKASKRKSIVKYSKVVFEWRTNVYCKVVYAQFFYSWLYSAFFVPSIY